MVNFRYHIVSITAVFLALGLGVALGGTFLDRVTVDLLEANIDRAEARIRRADERVGELTDDLSRAEQREKSLTEIGGRVLFDGLLTDEPVLVITQPDVDPELLRDVTRSLEFAGADFRGTLELTPAMAMTGPIDPDLANVVSVSPDRIDEARDAVDSTLRLVLLDAGVEDGEDDDGDHPDTSTDPDTDTDTDVDTDADTDTESDTSADTETDPNTDAEHEADGQPRPRDTGSTDRDLESPEILTALLDAGYLRHVPPQAGEPEDDLLTTPGHRYVILGSSAPTDDDNQLLLRLLSDREQSAIPAVVVVDTPATADAGDSPTIVAAVRGTPELEELYPTVDNAGAFTGLVAMLLSTRDIRVSDPSHLGQAPGATALLPVSAGS